MMKAPCSPISSAPVANIQATHLGEQSGTILMPGQGTLPENRRPTASHMRSNISAMNETAIRQAAAHMIRLHGDEAELAASRQADAMLSRGNVGGFHTWNRIATLINDLGRKADIEP